MDVEPRGPRDQSASQPTVRRRRLRRAASQERQSGVPAHPPAPASFGRHEVLGGVGRHLPAATTVTALIGLLFTAVKLNEDHQASQRQLANSTFTQAITALGSDQPTAVKVGGLYALEQIANESE